MKKQFNADGAEILILPFFILRFSFFIFEL
jgi:hypothetical protein